MILPMASVPTVLFLLGTLLLRIPREEREAPLSAALMAVALIWLIMALVSGLPLPSPAYSTFTVSVMRPST